MPLGAFPHPESENLTEVKVQLAVGQGVHVLLRDQGHLEEGEQKCQMGRNG